MERNVTLDFVRGVAILGILLLNISAFGLPKAAYLNPAWSGTFPPATPGLGDSRSAGAGQIPDPLRPAVWRRTSASAAARQALIQSRLTPLALLGFIHGLFFWDGDILLAYALVGLVGWRMVRDAHDVKSLFNTGVVLYVIGVAVLLLLGLISGNTPNRSWLPDAANLQYEQYWKLKGGFEAVSNRADMLSDNLLALGAQYGWQLAGMMLMGAALMRSGWLKGQFSLRHYRRTGGLLIAAGMAVNLPSIIAQWHLGWDYRWCAFLLQAPRELGAPLQTIGYAALAWGFWPQLCQSRLVGAIACVGRMALTNYLLQTLICTTLFYRFGLFMKYDRLQLLAFVPAVWAVNLLFSWFWLRHFRQGPVEWLWRQFTLRASGTSLKDTSR